MKAYVCVTVVLLAAIDTRPAATQRPSCDPGLPPFKESPYAYGPLDDRCEGLYLNLVGGTTLTIVSLTSGFEDYDLASTDQIRFAWSAPASRGLRIRVRGIQPDLYYGMDAQRPGKDTSYEWSTAILSALNILKPDIGVLAWTPRKIGGVWRNVYIPVRVTQTAKPAHEAGYSLVLYPGQNLKEVYLTLGRTDANGEPIAGQPVIDREPQNQKYYPAEGPIQIALPALAPPGLYYMEISATLPKGNPIAMDPLLIDTSGP